MKAFFHSRALREKTLLLTFAALALIILAGRVARHGRAWGNDLRATKTESIAQKLWLKNAAAIDAQAASAAKSLDPVKTINATRLVGELNALAGSADLNADIGSQHTERTSQFAFHSVQVNVRRADLAALVRFYTALSQRSPYIGLEQFTLAADRTTPGQLNASFRVVAVELGK